jgi:hypothetical protein
METAFAILVLLVIFAALTVKTREWIAARRWKPMVITAGVIAAIVAGSIVIATSGEPGQSGEHNTSVEGNSQPPKEEAQQQSESAQERRARAKREKRETEAGVRKLQELEVKKQVEAEHKYLEEVNKAIKGQSE